MDISDKLTNLKNQLLDLAIRGKLVEQRPEEGTAEELYTQIQEEKNKLIAEGKIKKEKPLPEITDYEMPFDIPESWKWVRLSQCIQVNPTVQCKDETDVSFIPMAAVEAVDVKNNFSRFAEYDVLVAKITPCFQNRKSAIAKGLLNNYGAGTTEFNVLRTTESLYNKFVLFFVKSAYFIDYGQEHFTGTAGQQRFGGASLREMLFPLPPLAEQKRIVAKLESYLAIIDKAEELIERKANLDEEIRNKILDLAIRGKLVEQRPEEGTAEELYAQIQEEKKKLIAEGKIKKEKPLPEITDDEIPFEIPESWKWVRIGNIISIARGASPRPIKAFITEDTNGINWIKIGDTTEGDKYINSSKEKITQEGSLKSRVVHSGDFLLTNSMSFGHPYILNIDGCVHDGWLILSDYSSCYDKLFLYYLLSSSFAYIQFSEAASGTTVKNLNSDKVSSSIFPLPPLAEQKRIVAKIEELLPYCDKLK